MQKPLNVKVWGGLLAACVVMGWAQPAYADNAVFRTSRASTDGQTVNCYSNAGAVHFRKAIRHNHEGAIYNFIPPPKRVVTVPKPVRVACAPANSANSAPAVTRGARSILSYEQSGNQQLPARHLHYMAWDAEHGQYTPARCDLGQIISSQAREQGIDPLIVQLIIKRESGFEPTAASGVGAQGLMQLMPDTAAALGVKDPNDPAENIAAGTRYFADQYRRYGDLHLALAAYNAGPGNVEAYNGVPPFQETIDYVNSIAVEYEALKKAR